MPKVSKEYIENKKNEILDSALKVALRKPVYEVSMRDIISESGFSQGGIYRYFSNIDDILVELINREFIEYDVENDIRNIINSDRNPENVVLELLLVWKKIVLDSIIGVGKIYYETCTMYINDKKRLENHLRKCNLSKNSGYIEKESFAYIVKKIEDGYFSPKLSQEDIFTFIATSFDGITRDLIFFKVYNYGEMLDYNIDMDGEKLIRNLAVALVLLLGGDEKLLIK